jgi:cytochrome c biogenesis protein
MVVGFYMAFFMSHRRVWIKLTENPGGTLVEIAGAGHRDRAGFKKEFEKIDQAMQELQRKK